MKPLSSTPAAPAALLRMTGAMKRRSQGDSVFVLHIPDFVVRRGEVLALVGDSGCGKSTLLDILALVMEPTEVASFSRHDAATGAVTDLAALWRAGAESRLAALRRDHLGYVLQTGGLLSFLSVEQNIRLPSQVKGVQSSAGELAALADRLGLVGCLSRRPDSLSIGQRQRVAILRALLHGPDLVLADEPTAALDKARALAVMADLRSLARERQCAVVVVTHDMELIRDQVDRRYTFVMQAVSPTETHSTVVVKGG